MFLKENAQNECNLIEFAQLFQSINRHIKSFVMAEPFSRFKTTAIWLLDKTALYLLLTRLFKALQQSYPRIPKKKSGLSSAFSFGKRVEARDHIRSAI